MLARNSGQGSSHFSPQGWQSSPRGHTKNSRGIGMVTPVRFCSAENLEYLWNGAR